MLFISILLYFLSGYGMTKGILDYSFAKSLHSTILPMIALTAFVIHTFFATRITFIRWRVWNNVVKVIWASVYILGFGVFVFLQFFIAKPTKPTTTQPTSQKQPQTVSQEKIFTLEELSKYDGKNGNPAYVAVDGVVYDVTMVFRNGIHYEHLAGQELSQAFYTKHVKQQITKYPVVGKLQ